MQRVTEIDKMGSTYSVFETKTPVKYLTFLVGKLALVQQNEDSLPLFSYVSSDVRFPKKNILEEAGKILDFYQGRFGPFPFETLSIVQRLWMSSGGHSPASFIVLNDIPRTSQREPATNFVYGTNSPVDLAEWKEYFLAHEIAHQWWGQGVTWARYRDQWLSEGVAQFASILYIRSKHNHRAFSNILKKFATWTEQKSRFGPITLGSRLSFLDFQAYQAIVYNKSALVLNMLLDLLGEEVFFAGLMDFLREYKYSAASTGQFKRVMERAAGRDLDGFFSLWFDSHLLPESRVSYATIPRQGSLFLKLRVEQVGDVFVYPLWVEWQEKGGAGRHREKVTIEEKSQEFEFPLQNRATKVVINPDRAVPGKITAHRG
jgi:aminopeptidase N